MTRSFWATNKVAVWTNAKQSWYRRTTMEPGEAAHMSAHMSVGDGVKTHLLSWCNQPIARVQKPSISYLVSTFGGQVACYLLSCFVLKMNHIFGRFLHDSRSVWVFLLGFFLLGFLLLGFFLLGFFCLGYLGLRYANKKMWSSGGGSFLFLLYPSSLSFLCLTFFCHFCFLLSFNFE